ncbi:MAG: 3-mercaptopyruvate sulfurtransferase [Pseudomonadota bacterium]
MSLAAPLVSTDWLHANLDAARIIDASWRMPGEPPAYKDYQRRHISGAVFFDIDALADKSTDLPHMLPSPSDFENAVGALGVNEDDAVVVYDDQGLFSAPRVWWTFRAMGHARVAVLDGGLRKWIAEGRAVDDRAPRPSPQRYKASPKRDLVADAETVRTAIADAAPRIVDARPAARFRGAAPEPRAGLRSGHMPGALNVPVDRIVRDDGTLADDAALRAAFEDAGVDVDAPIITTCGSGVTAAVAGLALEVLGHRRWRLYDASWAEWARRDHDSSVYPVVVDV